MRAALMGLLLVGCVHAPPAELVEARQAYVAASRGPAATYAPDDLDAARNELSLSQRALEDDLDDVKAADHAYVASRKIDSANAKARMELEMAKLEALNQQAQALKAQRAPPVAPPPPPPPPEAIAQARQPAPAAPEPLGEAIARATAPAASSTDAPSSRPSPLEGRGSGVAPPDLPELASVADVRQDPRGTVLTVPVSLVFAAGGAKLDDSGKQRLDTIAAALKKRREHVTIEVHTDNLGTPDENAQLSEQRANAVREYLVSKGLKSARVEAHGLGDTHPLVGNDTPQGRATNRRLEIVLEAPPVS